MIVTRIKPLASYAVSRLRAVLNNGLALIVIGVIIWQVGPWVDSRFPVVDSASIVDVIPQDDGAVIFRYLFTKHRDCQIIATNWFYKDGEVTGQADITRSGQTPTRPVGLNLSVWWRIGTGEKLPGTFFVVNTYNCRLPWSTESTLGPFRIERKESG